MNALSHHLSPTLCQSLLHLSPRFYLIFVLDATKQAPARPYASATPNPPPAAPLGALAAFLDDVLIPPEPPLLNQPPVLAALPAHEPVVEHLLVNEQGQLPDNEPVQDLLPAPEPNKPRSSARLSNKSTSKLDSLTCAQTALLKKLDIVDPEQSPKVEHKKRLVGLFSGPLTDTAILAAMDDLLDMGAAMPAATSD
ncbi:hypothetical protein PVAP13_7KG120755 [Panicum virgatum]|uniref:Uncharacterized protein n=1 Tax=Panicum virgatum TaxID=38727 RepID=A0A8T0QAL4_PANVG|nr:hypothetical protein PVAP13_7KG120755 [Panicum virgatum]